MADKSHRAPSCRLLLVAPLTLIAMSGCASNKSAFYTVQLCLKDQEDLVEFKKIISIEADYNSLRFIDRSAQTEKELQTINQVETSQSNAHTVINVGALGEDGMGLMATDLGSADYQIGIGFFEGSNRARAQRFANGVVSALKKRWDIHFVPRGRGAQPLKNCT